MLLHGRHGQEAPGAIRDCAEVTGGWPRHAACYFRFTHENGNDYHLRYNAESRFSARSGDYKKEWETWIY